MPWLLLGTTLVQTLVLCLVVAFWVVAIGFSVMAFMDIWFRWWSVVAVIAGAGVMLASYLFVRN
jgi:hypothetical protein